MKSAPSCHYPVMLQEMLHHLNPQANETIVDCTLGGGGYTRAILNHADVRCFALDRDTAAIERAKVWAPIYGDRLKVLSARFSQLKAVIQAQANQPFVDGIVMDIGLSSDQLADDTRGFSFMRDGPLDMRMGQSALTAFDVVNTFSEKDIADILYKYGEERASRRIASAIVKQRKLEPIATTSALSQLIEHVLPRGNQPIHPATRSFQALRIFINQELTELTDALAAAFELLNVGGRLVVVSFHSLEDRIVKHCFSQYKTKKYSRPLPFEPVITMPPFNVEFLTKGAQQASLEEIRQNPRSRSAKLRAVRKLSQSECAS